MLSCAAEAVEGIARKWIYLSPCESSTSLATAIITTSVAPSPALFSFVRVLDPARGHGPRRLAARLPSHATCPRAK